MTEPYYTDESTVLWHGDCVQVMRGMDDNSVHAIVTDPPYALNFMGKSWDRFDAAGSSASFLAPASGKAKSRGYADNDNVAFQAWCETWAAEALRVLRPGGHLLAFGGTRTFHRLACAIEDAGFEIRDSITWLYGSGFPKSLDVSKAIDRTRDDRDAIVLVTSAMADAADARGVTRNVVDAHMGTSDMGGWWLTRLRHRCQCPTLDQWLALKALLGMPNDLDAEVWRLNGRKGTPGEAWDLRAVIGTASVPVGHAFAGSTYGGDSSAQVVDVTAPSTDAARTWQGWGTALKPAHEPIVVARKPLVGTVAQNVTRWGTGAINIDGTRVGTDDVLTDSGTPPLRYGGANARPFHADAQPRGVTQNPAGRWPSNVVFTHSPSCADRCVDGCPIRELDRQSGVSRDTAAGVGSNGFRTAYVDGTAKPGVQFPQASYGGEGGSSRFFPTFRYEAKAPTLERPSYVKDGAGTGRVTGLGGKVRQCNVCETRAIASGDSEPSCGHGDYRWEQPTADTSSRVAHSTVKPLDLMRFLVRLVTPPNGTVLDMFAGSGTTLEAAMLEGFNSVGIEQDADYLPLIAERIRRGKAQGHQGDLFGGAA